MNFKIIRKNEIFKQRCNICLYHRPTHFEYIFFYFIHLAFFGYNWKKSVGWKKNSSNVITQNNLNKYSFFRRCAREQSVPCILFQECRKKRLSRNSKSGMLITFCSSDITFQNINFVTCCTFSQNIECNDEKINIQRRRRRKSPIKTNYIYWLRRRCLEHYQQQQQGKKWAATTRRR